MQINKEELLTKHPSDIAETIAALNPREQIVAFFLLPGDIEGEVFAYFERPIQENILSSKLRKYKKQFLFYHVK